MNRIYYFLIMIFVAGMYNPEVSAGNKGRGDPYAFLNIGAGARAMGMGNAYVAIAEGAESTYWNPAGLASLENIEIIFMYRPPVIDEIGEKYAYLSYVQPFSKWKVSFGMSLIYLGIDDIEKTKIGNYDEPIILGSFKDSETAIILSIGKELYKNLCAIGLNGKYIEHRLDEQRGKGRGGDFSCLVNLSEAMNWRGIFREVKFGAVIRYLADKNWDSGHKDSGYIEEELGVAWIPVSNENSKLTIAISVEQRQEQPTKLPLGVELQIYKKIFAIRAGIDNLYLTGRHGLDKRKLNYNKKFTIGGGLKIKFIEIDIEGHKTRFDDFKQQVSLRIKF